MPYLDDTPERSRHGFNRRTDAHFTGNCRGTGGGGRCGSVLGLFSRRWDKELSRGEMRLKKMLLLLLVVFLLRGVRRRRERGGPRRREFAEVPGHRWSRSRAHHAGVWDSTDDAVFACVCVSHVRTYQPEGTKP